LRKQKNTMVPGRWAAISIDQDLMNFENAATVRLAATFGLIDCHDDESVADVLDREDTRNIDYIPVRRKKRVVGVLSRAQAENARGSRVRDSMVLLDSAMVASSSDPLLPILERLDEEPRFRLVLEGGEVKGIFTLSDLQKLPVATLIFARLAHFETLLTQVLRRKLESDEDKYLKLVPDDLRPRCVNNLKRMRKGHQEIDLFQASYLPEKLHVGDGLGLFPGEGDELKTLPTRIKQLRNDIAHSNEYAVTRDAAQETVRTLRELLRLITHLQTVAVGEG
jgi:hypothetical protein